MASTCVMSWCYKGQGGDVRRSKYDASDVGQEQRGGNKSACGVQLDPRGSGGARSLSQMLGPVKWSPGTLAPAGELTKSWALFDHHLLFWGVSRNRDGQSTTQ